MTKPIIPPLLGIYSINIKALSYIFDSTGFLIPYIVVYVWNPDDQCHLLLKEGHQLYDIIVIVKWQYAMKKHIEGLVQNCSNSIANALELLQSCTKSLAWSINHLMSYTHMSLA